MKMKEIFENHYDELTELEKEVYETSDQYSSEMEFDNLENYKEFVKLYFE